MSSLREFRFEAGLATDRTMELADLLAELPIERRLALSYAPKSARGPIAALFVLDGRLARIVSQGREPMLVQMKLAWWRDRLGEPPEASDRGDPLLKLFADWGAARQQLVALVDGWEALLSEPPLPDTAIAAYASGRAKACGALAQRLGAEPAEAERAGRNWALAELAGRIGNPDEASRVRAWAGQADWSRPKLTRALRPLLVLHGLSARRKGRGPLLSGPSDFLCALRVGLFGR